MSNCQAIDRSLVEVVPQSHRGVLGLINRRKYAVCIATKPDEDDEDDNNDNNKGNSKEKKGEEKSGKKSDYRMKGKLQSPRLRSQ